MRYLFTPGCGVPVVISGHLNLTGAEASMNLFEKLTPAETRRLASFLSSVAAPADSLTIMELKGFLFALCCAPHLLLMPR